MDPFNTPPPPMNAAAHEPPPIRRAVHSVLPDAAVARGPQLSHASGAPTLPFQLDNDADEKAYDKSAFDHAAEMISAMNLPVGVRAALSATLEDQEVETINAGKVPEEPAKPEFTPIKAEKARGG